MKIAINGDVINTEHIYKIGKIVSGYWESGSSSRWFNERKGSPTARDTNVFLIHLYGDKQLSLWNDNINKLSDFRDSIIKAWSENQPTIPQFNLE